MTSTVASLGALMLWDVDEGLTQIDKYQWSTDEHVKAGALMAFGLVSSGVQSDCDPSWALLAEHVDPSSSSSERIKLSAVTYSRIGLLQS